MDTAAKTVTSENDSKVFNIFLLGAVGVNKTSLLQH